MIPKGIKEDKSLAETIARMEAELNEFKEFLLFMKQESENLTNQPEPELETIRK